MNRTSGQAGRIAITAMLTALSLVFLYASVLLPTGQMGVVAVAGLLPAAAVVSCGLVSGVLCWVATGLLGLLMLPGKGNALLYVIFFGLYPLVKCLIERRKQLLTEYVLKLVFFNVVLTIFWFGLRTVFLAALPLPSQAIWFVYLAGNAAFLVYDFGFTKLIAFYVQRVDKVLRKGCT